MNLYRVIFRLDGSNPEDTELHEHMDVFANSMCQAAFDVGGVLALSDTSYEFVDVQTLA